MKIIWQIDPEDIFKVSEFYGHHCQNAFVKMRMASNLKDDKAPISKEMFWEHMIGCLLTTQQRSGPTSAVNRFLSKHPFLLRYEICRTQTELDQFVTRTLSEFGGLRRSTRIGTEALSNSNYLEKGGWEQTFKILENVRLKPNQESERRAAAFVDTHFRGFGPKQARNLLQGLGLSRFEVPIDSRITNWLNEFGFPIKLSANALADPNYFQFVSDGFQHLSESCGSESCGIVPCVLDAAIFSSFDGGNWTADNVTW